MENTPFPELPADDESAEVTRFPVEPFIARSGGTMGRYLIVLVGGLALGAGFAYLFGLIAFLAFVFFFVFPIIFGLCMGFGVGWIARLVRARTGEGSKAVVLIAMLCGAIAYGGFHLAFYLNGHDAKAVAGESFVQSLERRATQGYVLTWKRINANFGYTGTWIYWAIEMGITSLSAAGIASTIASGPYCESCDRWKRKRQFGPFPFDAVAGETAFLDGEPTKMFLPGPDDNKVKIDVYDCPTCPQEAPLDISYTGTVGKGKKMVTHSAFLTYPHSSLPAFEAIEMIVNIPKS